jgi:cysteinyl-tRNA synthetase
MALRFYNTLSRNEEEFRPLDFTGKHVSLYCCGPTVYNFAHIGNFRTFVFEDLLRRHLESRGYDVTHVMNITDVEDKIIRTIKESGEALEAFTRKYEKAFLDDLQTLGCQKPKMLPRATEHIADIVKLIQALEQKGIAYKANDGSVYFAIDKFPSYGRLARLDRTQLKAGARVSQDEHGAESYGDFALWKAYKEEDGEVSWDSPWGKGRPGWHIECSCMSMKNLGETIDLHCGGEDLVFPHHEDEIAQSEAATGKPFVRYWLHSAHLLVNGEKMSKSAGNFFTLRDLLGKGYSGREIRYSLSSAHYRLPLNFTMEGLEGARQALKRLDTWKDRLVEKSNKQRVTQSGPLLDSFSNALDGDLNISEALGVLFENVRESNRLMDENKLDALKAALYLRDWELIEGILGLPRAEAAAIPDDVRKVAEERKNAKQAKDWKRADELRNEIKQKGWLVEDLPNGNYKLTPI